jgi:hypothetical protein
MPTTQTKLLDFERAGTATAVQEAALSPDGSQVVYVTGPSPTRRRA